VIANPEGVAQATDDDRKMQGQKNGPQWTGGRKSGGGQHRAALTTDNSLPHHFPATHFPASFFA
jgi:hypothetical protein